jgi:hypothetical protein
VTKRLAAGCVAGANVTGALLMCLRKLQMWGLPCIIGEFTRFTRYLWHGCPPLPSSPDMMINACCVAPLPYPFWAGTAPLTRPSPSLWSSSGTRLSSRLSCRRGVY